MELHYTLIGDGPTDSALLPILDWLITKNRFIGNIHGEFADLRRYAPRARCNLANKILASLKLYPCDILFIHRDAEREPRANRLREINGAINKIIPLTPMVPSVCIIPIRMTETWLLFDEPAIRKAAGNPNGDIPLSLPRLSRLEGFTRPKEHLRQLLKQASGLSARRLDNFPVSFSLRRISSYIDDFSPLRSLSAFNAVENDLRNILKQHGWT
jgi:hypothetical protein